MEKPQRSDESTLHHVGSEVNKKHPIFLGRSRSGVASFTIALLIILWESVFAFFFWYLTTPGMMGGGDAGGAIAGAAVWLSLMAMAAGFIPAMVGLLLGTIAFCRRYEKRRLAMIGLIINILLLTVPIGFFCVGILIAGLRAHR